MYLESWTAPVIRKDEYSKTERLESWKQKENRSEEQDRKNPPEPSLCAEQVCRSSLFRQCVVLLTVVAERR